MASKLRPSLPPELYRLSPGKTALGIAYAVLLWLLPLLAAAALWNTPGLGVLPKAVLSFPLVLLCAQGVVLLVFLAHDGTHLNLSRNPHVSTLMALVLTLPAWPHCEMGFALCHWNHHRYTNTERDPDCAGYKRHRGLWSRMFLSRPAAWWTYLRTTAEMVTNSAERDPRKSYRMALPPRSRRLYAALNLAMWLGWLGFIVFAAVTNPVLFWLMVAVLAMVTMILGLNPYIEHAGTEFGVGRDARSRTGWLWTALYLGQNNHLEHHLYPSVPFYNLGKVHRFLRESGFHERRDSSVSHGLADTYRHALPQSRYPEGDRPDDTFDVVAASSAERRQADAR